MASTARCAQQLESVEEVLLEALVACSYRRRKMLAAEPSRAQLGTEAKRERMFDCERAPKRPRVAIAKTPPPFPT